MRPNSTEKDKKCSCNHNISLFSRKIAANSNPWLQPNVSRLLSAYSSVRRSCWSWFASRRSESSRFSRNRWRIARECFIERLDYFSSVSKRWRRTMQGRFFRFATPSPPSHSAPVPHCPTARYIWHLNYPVTTNVTIPSLPPPFPMQHNDVTWV